MRKYFISLVFILVVVCAFAQEGPKIKFDEPRKNIGYFPKDSIIQKVTYTFSNIGDEPLIIHQINTTCVCVTSEFSRTKVNPGEKGKLTLIFNGAKSHPGHFKKTAYILSNAPTVRIFVEGDYGVKPAAD